MSMFLRFEILSNENYKRLLCFVLYLKCYVLLLGDVFEKIRSNSLKNCGLCPNRYLSAPVLC